MDQLLIRGGIPLQGSIRVSGAKNAALPCITAGLLTEGDLRLTNVPRLKDIETICRLLRHMGVTVEEDGAGGLAVSGRAVTRFEAPYDLVRTMRASVLVLGPLVARFGRARVSLPGGCAIGPRPINPTWPACSRWGQRSTSARATWRRRPAASGGPGSSLT